MQRFEVSSLAVLYDFRVLTKLANPETSLGNLAVPPWIQTPGNETPAKRASVGRNKSSHARRGIGEIREEYAAT